MSRINLNRDRHFNDDDGADIQLIRLDIETQKLLLASMLVDVVC